MVLQKLIFILIYLYYFSSSKLYIFYTMDKQNVERNVLSRIQSGGSNLFYIDLETI